MEIERKWMVAGWPAGLEQTSVYNMDQGYTIDYVKVTPENAADYIK